MRWDTAWASFLPERDFCDGESTSALMAASEGMEARRKTSAATKRLSSSKIEEVEGRPQPGAEISERNLRRAQRVRFRLQTLHQARLTQYQQKQNANRRLTLGCR